MIKVIIKRGLLFTLLWFILTEGKMTTLGLGVVAILSALWVSIRLLPPSPSNFSLAGFLQFLAYFVWNSFRGGIQVSIMAFRGSHSIQPAILEWKLSLPPGAPRILLISSIGLMPGTVGVELKNDLMRFHVIDERLPVFSGIGSIEKLVAKTFGVKT
jgi:multicomponent Na+:H+ antiporter subunit E